MPKESRRRLIQGGLAGAPLLLALTSVPALAADCKQPSGFSASGNLSQNGTTACSPKMNGVKFWQDYCNANPAPSGTAVDTMTFSGVFTATSGVTATFRSILTTSAGTLLQKKIVAAWLSAKAGSSLFTTDTVVKMWNDGVVGNAFHPSATMPSVTWTSTQVEQYLDYVLA
ncbi:hypothetical protein [Zoogloea sp.]|uniref:hypothetical protein n=1 Tax=Zoogloea sp. TaxID=49181 RepID=UPI0014167616|nr:MAG: hypothetical protein F9K15_04580 [Zoogloea sp.]